MPLPPEILEPIDGPDPAGSFLRYDTTDTTYAEIKEAREEDDVLPQGEWERERKTADYRKVVELATTALVERTKDLQIAAWLAEALTHREGFAGFREGLDLIRGLLEDFWDDVKPPLDDDGDVGFRASALAWVAGELGGAVRSVGLTREGYGLIDYRVSRSVGYEEDAEGDPEKLRALEEAISAGRPTADAFDEAVAATPKSWYKELVSDLDGSLESLEELDALVEERFEEEAPSFRVLREALTEVRDRAGKILDQKLEEDPDEPEIAAAVPGEEGAPSEDGPGAGSAAAASGAASAGSAGSSSPRGAVPTSWEDAASHAAAAARFMRSEDPTNPAPYLLLRGLRWGEIRSGDGELDPRLLAAPPTSTRTRLKGLLLDAQWEELLEEAEEVMATPFGRGWLDLQRYALTACDGLGDSYDGVAEGVREELRALLRERPELPDLTLMDDSPTANSETRSWLQEAGILEVDEEALEEARKRRKRIRPSRSPSDRAWDRVRAGHPREGIQILMDRANQEKSARARFLLHSQAARIMVDAGLESVAMPILNEMLQEIEEHTLEEWEDGETVALPLGLLYRCMTKLDSDPQGRDQLYQRVCRLDPVHAMQLDSGGDGSVAAAAEDATVEAGPEASDGEG